MTTIPPAAMDISELLRAMPRPGALAEQRDAWIARKLALITAIEEATTGTDDRPQPRNLIGEDGQHRLVRSGYMVVTVCRSCGAPLTSPKSVALQLGPTCARRVAA